MKAKILQLIDSYWKFDDNQQPLSSWHDKQDLLKAVDELSTPALTPEKLGEMFDSNSKMYHRQGDGFLAMTKESFIRLVTEITSQPRQPETEIHLPSDEAVRDWFKGLNDPATFWDFRSSNTNRVICDLIIEALKYFIVTWQPVRNSKQSEIPDLKSGDYQNNRAPKTKLEIPDNNWSNPGFTTPKTKLEIDTNAGYIPILQSEIPEDRLREEPKSRKERVDEARLWLSNMGYGTGTNMTFNDVGILLDQYLNERKEQKS